MGSRKSSEEHYGLPPGKLHVDQEHHADQRLAEGHQQLQALLRIERDA